MKINTAFNELLAESGVPCISMIIPTYRLSPERAQNPIILSDAVERTKDFWDKYVSGASDKKILVQRLDNLIKEIDFNHTLDGIGIYVSLRISKIIDFPFSVKEKIKIGNSFDIRDLLYDLHTIINYKVLSITKKNIKLFELVGNEMVAIGFEEVWKAAKEGKGLELVVEKDLEHIGYINEREFKLRLHKPIDRGKYLFVSDIVERIIKTVYNKRGKIIFFENGELEDFGGIAMILRCNVKEEV
ncbi:MAG: hypothetical protein H0W84_05155 [Bacteroidetes bacterium]|nr:hypothetical protein [Bacteroidota bacterium]